MLLFKSVFEKGVELIKSEDREQQRKYIEVISRYRFIDVEYLLNLGCFFVPNQDYLLDRFGPDCLKAEYDFYSYDGQCRWLGCLMIPIRDVFGNISGFTGFNPASSLIRKDNKENNSDLEVPRKYKISSKTCFDKNKFMLIPNGYEKILKDDYCIVLDGVFDAITLASFGLNTCCNLGTTLSTSVIYMLSFPSRRYISADNDLAGLSLLNLIKSKLPNTVAISQNKYKDIDEYIYREGPNYAINKIKEHIASKLFIPIIL